MYYEPMISRALTKKLAASKKSILLLGPRQVGKSTLIKQLQPDLIVNLADQADYLSFSSNPSEIKDRISESNPRTVFIDEIQRLPSLLNTLQVILDNKSPPLFFLSGSSARKLRRGKANLLPGRLFSYQLGPLVPSELKDHYDEDHGLKFGFLPDVFLEKSESVAKKKLRSYVSTYLQEEIRAEAIVRNLESFTRFLHVAIAEAGKFIDYSKLAQRAKISRHAFSRFYEIFEDTLIGDRVWPFDHPHLTSELVRHPKFYLFDNGVYNAVVGSFDISEDRLGRVMEQHVFNCLRHTAWSYDKDIKISTFRTRGGYEVDFVVEVEGRLSAVEVKATANPTNYDVESLLSFKDYVPSCRNQFLVYRGKKAIKRNGIWCLPASKAIEEILQ